MILPAFDRGEYVLSSGTRVPANGGIFGLDPSLKVTEGYDNSVEWPPFDYGLPPEPGDPPQLTADDMREIADMMIKRWQNFRASLDAPAGQEPSKE